MSIALHTVSGGKVEAINDARLYNALTKGVSGIAEGGVCSASGGLVVHLTSGWGALLGRIFTIEAEDITVTPSSSGTVNGRIYIKIDLSADEVCTIESEASATLRNLTQQNINNNGTIFEYELCRYKVSEVAVSNLVTNIPVVLGGDCLTKSAFSFDASTGTLTLTLD